MRPLIPLFWTSGDICPGFQSQGGCGATPANLLMASMAAGRIPNMHVAEVGCRDRKDF